MTAETYNPPPPDDPPAQSVQARQTDGLTRGAPQTDRILVAALGPAHLVMSLLSGLCPCCAGAKKPRNTLCGNCYLTLPRQVAVPLYRRLGEGYAQAVIKAMNHLGKSEFIIQRRNP